MKIIHTERKTLSRPYEVEVEANGLFLTITSERVSKTWNLLRPNPDGWEPQPHAGLAIKALRGESVADAFREIYKDSYPDGMGHGGYEILGLTVNKPMLEVEGIQFFSPVGWFSLDRARARELSNYLNGQLRKKYAAHKRRYNAAPTDMQTFTSLLSLFRFKRSGFIEQKIYSPYGAIGRWWNPVLNFVRYGRASLNYGGVFAKTLSSNTILRVHYPSLRSVALWGFFVANFSPSGGITVCKLDIGCFRCYPVSRLRSLFCSALFLEVSFSLRLIVDLSLDAFRFQIHN